MAHAFKLEPAASPALEPAVQPHLRIVRDADGYDDLLRLAPEVGTVGIHPATLGIVASLYAALVAVFWLTFVRDAETGLVLAVVTVLMIMYLGLLLGGIAVADAPPPGTASRSFRDFVRGKVEIATGAIDGHEALLQIVFLPVCMVSLALVIAGIVASL